MKVLFLGGKKYFDCVPRKYPNNGDVLTLVLTNETSKVVLTPTITIMIAQKLRIELDTEPVEFVAKDKYEIQLKNGDEVIYIGKLIVLENNTDVQNYELSSQSNSKFKYND